VATASDRYAAWLEEERQQADADERRARSESLRRRRSGLPLPPVERDMAIEDPDAEAKAAAVSQSVGRPAVSRAPVALPPSRRWPAPPPMAPRDVTVTEADRTVPGLSQSLRNQNPTAGDMAAKMTLGMITEHPLETAAWTAATAVAPEFTIPLRALEVGYAGRGAAKVGMYGAKKANEALGTDVRPSPSFDVSGPEAAMEGTFGLLMGSGAAEGVLASERTAAESSAQFEDALRNAQARSVPYRWAKAQNVAEVRPERLLPSSSVTNPVPTEGPDVVGPAIPTGPETVSTRDNPWAPPERMLPARSVTTPTPTAGEDVVGPAIPSGAVPPDLEAMFPGVVPPERRLGRGPLVTPSPDEPMRQAMQWAVGQRAARAARGESDFDMADFVARRRGEPTAAEVERQAMQEAPEEVPQPDARPVRNAEGYFEDVKTGSGVYRKVDKVSNDGLLRYIAEQVDDKLGTHMNARYGNKAITDAITRKVNEAEAELERRGLTTDQIWGPEMDRVRAERQAAKAADQAATDQGVLGEDTSFDFGPRAGATRTPVVATLAGGAAGAAGGGAIGDTPEERRRNAAIGFMVGAAGGAGASVLSARLAARARIAARAKFLRDGREGARAAGLTPDYGESVIEDAIAGQPRRTGAIGDVEKVGGSGSPLGQNRVPAKRPAIEHAAPELGNLSLDQRAQKLYEDASGSPWKDASDNDRAAFLKEAQTQHGAATFGGRLYSRAARAINDAPFAKGTGQQWAAALSKGVSKIERGEGLDAFLAENKDKVLTRDQVAEVFNQHRIKIGEEVYTNLSGDYAGNDGTRYYTYTLPGGDNYKETILTLQRPRPAPGASEEAPYHSSHWPSVKNPLVHIRTKDRIGPDGKKTLFVEELQSDWHQEGRDKGYRVPAPPITPAEQKAGNDALGSVIEQMKAEVRIRHPEWNATHLDQFARGVRLTLPDYVAEAGPEGVRRWATAGDLLNIQVSDAQAQAIARIFPRENWTLAVPDAPFKKTDQWVELGLKKILDDAVRGGYDRVAFVTGKQSADRYNLAQYVDDLQYDPLTERLVASKNGNVLHEGKYDAKALPDVIGKDAAKRLLETPVAEGMDVHQLKGEQLQVGGQGMAEFYDKIVPKVLRDYAKTLGVEVEMKPGAVGRGGLDAKRIDEIGLRHFETDEEAANVLSAVARTMESGDASDWRHVITAMRQDIAAGHGAPHVFEGATLEGVAKAEKLLEQADAAGNVTDADLLRLAQARARAAGDKQAAEILSEIRDYHTSTGDDARTSLEAWLDGPGKMDPEFQDIDHEAMRSYLGGVADRRGAVFNPALNHQESITEFARTISDPTERAAAEAVGAAFYGAPPGLTWNKAIDVARHMDFDGRRMADDDVLWNSVARRFEREEKARRAVAGAVERARQGPISELGLLDDFVKALGTRPEASILRSGAASARRRGGGILDAIDFISKHVPREDAQMFGGGSQRAVHSNAIRWLEDLYFAKNSQVEPWLEGPSFDIMPELAAKVKAGQRLGFATPDAVSMVAGAGVGAVAGSTQGRTPEERERNAMLGAVAGAAGGAGAARVVGRMAGRAAVASTPALAKAAEMVASGERSAKRGVSFLTNPERAYVDIVDEAYPLSKFGRMFDKQHPERMAETIAQGQGWRGQALQYLDDFLKPLLRNVKGREADLQGYAVAKREQQLRAQGAAPKTTMTDAEIAAAVKDGDADPVLRAAQAKLTDLYRDLLKKRLDVGLLSQDRYDAILKSEDFYTPFTREWDGAMAPSGGNSGGKFVNRGAGVRAMDREQMARAKITDPLERFVLDATDTFRQVAKQKVTNVVGDIVAQNPQGVQGLIREVPTGTTPSPTARVVEPMVGGVRKKYEVTSPELYDAWASFDPRTMGIFEQIGSFFKRGLQAGVTLMPDFAVANLTRDTGQAAIQQPATKLLTRAAKGAAAGAATNVAFGDKDQSVALRALIGAGLGSGAAAIAPQVIKALTAVKSIITNDATYQDFMRSGAATDGFYPRNSTDARKVLANLRRDGVQATDIINPARWVDAMHYIGRVTEQATRVAKFAEQRRMGMTTGKAALEAQDVSLRFANIGKRTKSIASVTAFWNAKVQGWDKLTRLLKDPKTAAAGMATITAPTLALWAINKENPEYWDRPQWERNMFWLIPKASGGFYRIAKPFEIGFLFASLPERLADFAYQKSKGEDANPGETFRSAALDMANTTFEGTLPLPTVVGLGMEQAANYDTFRGRPIVGRPELPAEMQQDDRTSYLAKALGEKLHLSPQRIDHVVRSLGGSTAQLLSGTIDNVARRVGADTRAEPADAVPLLMRRFVTQDAGTTDQEQAVRRRFATADRVYQGARQLEREVQDAGADPATLQAYVDKNIEVLREREHLQKVMQGLNEITARRKALRNDRRLDKEARREEARILRLLGQELARAGMGPAPQATTRAVP